MRPGRQAGSFPFRQREITAAHLVLPHLSPQSPDLVVTRAPPDRARPEHLLLRRLGKAGTGVATRTIKE